MESISKIIKVILGGMVLSLPLGCIGQNIYNSETIYYNRDTLLCVGGDAQSWKLIHSTPDSYSSDSTGYYCSHCILKKQFDLPIVTVNDETIIDKLDSCLIDASTCDYLRFPDSSGYFVELFIYDKSEDSRTLNLAIKPHSNYYMADILLSDRNEILFEWFGYNDKDLHGCFYRNGILCVVTSSGWLKIEDVSCLFTHTQSTLRLALYDPILSLVKTSHVTIPEYYYYFEECGSNLKAADKKNSYRNQMKK